MVAEACSEHDGWEIQRFKGEELYMNENRSWESQMLHSVSLLSHVFATGTTQIQGEEKWSPLAYKRNDKEFVAIFNHSPSLDHKLFIFLTNANAVNSSKHS